VDVSGFVLSPCFKSMAERHPTAPPPLDAVVPLDVPARRRLEVLGGGVRVLHGGDLAKVTMLYHNAEGEAWSSCSSSVENTDGWTTALSVEAAARRVQRAWRARANRVVLGDAAGLAPSAPSSATATAAAALRRRQLRMPGDFPFSTPARLLRLRPVCETLLLARLPPVPTAFRLEARWQRQQH